MKKLVKWFELILMAIFAPFILVVIGIYFTAIFLGVWWETFEEYKLNARETHVRSNENKNNK